MYFVEVKGLPDRHRFLASTVNLGVGVLLSETLDEKGLVSGEHLQIVLFPPSGWEMRLLAICFSPWRRRQTLALRHSNGLQFSQACRATCPKEQLWPLRVDQVFQYWSWLHVFQKKKKKKKKDVEKKRTQGREMLYQFHRVRNVDRI